MTRGRKPAFSNETLALAMELASEGCCWKRIEQGLGSGIYQAVRDARRNGMNRHADS